MSMQGHGSRGGHSGGDGAHRGHGGLWTPGPGGRPSKVEVAQKTSQSDVKQSRLSFCAVLAPGSELKFEGSIELKNPPSYAEAAAVSGRLQRDVEAAARHVPWFIGKLPPPPSRSVGHTFACAV